MRFFCYHRDRPGSAAPRDTVLEDHWPCMDRYAAEMIARDPISTVTRPPAACTSSICRISPPRGRHGTIRGRRALIVSASMPISVDRVIR